MGCQSSNAIQEISEEKLTNEFKLLDKDNDGQIDKEEMVILLGKVMTNFSPKQIQMVVDDVFKSLDTDNDGKISFKEYTSKDIVISIKNTYK